MTTTLDGSWSVNRLVRRIGQDVRTTGEYEYRFDGRISSTKLRRIVDSFNDRYARDRFGKTSAGIALRHNDDDTPYYVVEMRALPPGPYEFENVAARFTGTL